MRTVLIWFFRVVAVLALLLVVALAVAFIGSRRALSQHLTTSTITALDHGANLGSRVFINDPALGTIPVPNLTGGIGGFSATHTDVDFIRAVRYGVSPEERPLLIMPAESYGEYVAQFSGCIACHGAGLSGRLQGALSDPPERSLTLYLKSVTPNPRVTDRHVVALASLLATGAVNAPSAGERHAVAAFVRYGTNAAATGFAHFRMHAAAFAPFLRKCNVKHESDGTVDFSCTSQDRATSVESLGRFLASIVPAELPRSLDRFACDSDSIGGYYLAWEHSYAYPLYVSAYVSFHGDSSYYVLTVSMRGRTALVPAATPPPESDLNDCSWTR